MFSANDRGLITNRFNLAKQLTILSIVSHLMIGRGNSSEFVIDKHEEHCPVDCTCLFDKDKVVIQCEKRHHTDEQDLTDEIDELLEEWRSVPKLSISNTPLKRMPPTICNMANLTDLNLDHNRLQVMPKCLKQLHGLSNFSAYNNSIRELPNGCIPQHISSIDLRYNLIDTIGEELFSNFGDLKDLRYIMLQHNLLRTLDIWPLIRGRVQPGARIWVSDNLISTFTNIKKVNIATIMNITSTANSSNKPPMNMFMSLSNNQFLHIMDILNGWSMSISDFLRLFGPGTHSTFSIDVSSKVYDCDCTDYELLSKCSNSMKTEIFTRCYCQSPAEHMHKSLVAVGYENMICTQLEDCPDKCLCSYIPYFKVVNVSCSGAKLVYLPTVLPKVNAFNFIYKADFSRSGFRDLEFRDYFLNISDFNIANSTVERINSSAWKALCKMKNVCLNGNRLTTLPETLGNANLTVTKMSLYDNPWDCSCGYGWIRHWMHLNQGNLLNWQGMLCKYPSWLYGKNIISTSEEEMCHDPVTELETANLVSIALGVSIGVVALLLLSLLTVYKFRVKIHASLQLHPFDRDECDGEDMEFDLFISCAESEGQVAMDILESVESNGYKVCYHKRDFVCGLPIAENICQSIATSKRVICLLSTGFLQSSYCMFEFQLAYHRDVQLRKHRLVMLKLEDVRLKVEEGDLLVKDHLERNTYIDYCSRNWKEQLFYTMPVNRTFATTPLY